MCVVRVWRVVRVSRTCLTCRTCHACRTCVDGHLEVEFLVAGYVELDEDAPYGLHLEVEEEAEVAKLLGADAVRAVLVHQVEDGA